MLPNIFLLTAFIFLADTAVLFKKEANNLYKFLTKPKEEDYNNSITKKVVDNGLKDEWDDYMKAFGKEYTPEEIEMRKAIFMQNKERMEKHNELFKQGKVSYETELNHLSDMTWEELRMMRGLLPHNSTRKRSVQQRDNTRYYKYSRGSTLPPWIDWRDQDYVTPVAYQGYCASCYAFSGIGALEGYHKKKTGKLISLSVQNVLDCTWDLGNGGCDGGFIIPVFDYARTNGIASKDQYPYTENASHNCEWKKEYAIGTAKGYLTVPQGDELSLQHAVANYGPIAVGMATTGFEGYKTGVFYSSHCGPMDHSFLVVGYATSPLFGDYWIVKNNWGIGWGRYGYMRLARNKNNHCHVATYAHFPI